MKVFKNSLQLYTQCLCVYEHLSHFTDMNTEFPPHRYNLYMLGTGFLQ